jgi:hypothetical protein
VASGFTLPISGYSQKDHHLFRLLETFFSWIARISIHWDVFSTISAAADTGLFEE